jgi:hypothetical protein
MRRTFVSLNKANGGDAKTIADRRGHDMGVSLRDAQTPIEVKSVGSVTGLERYAR